MKIIESEIQPYDDQIIGFYGERVDTRGYIDLYTTFAKVDTLQNHQNKVYFG